MIIGFTCGSYDLFHAGHVLSLKEAKEHCDWLIVGLQSDPSIDRDYKNRPVQGIEERHVQLQGCRYVDEVWRYRTEADLNDYLYDNKHRIDVRFLGMDWAGKKFTGHTLPIRCFFTSRTHGYSSSSLRKRVAEAELVKDFRKD